MNNNFDMCVNLDALNTTEEKLKLIESNLDSSIEMMKTSIINAQVYLEGKQFDKAMNTTNASIALAEKSKRNIQSAEIFISELKNALTKYGDCVYKEIN